MDAKINVYEQLEQRSKEWYQLRCGRVGGSEALGLSTAARMKTLTFLKASELISGQVETMDYESRDMARGKELEDVALQTFEQESFMSLEKVGYVTNDALPYVGWSPDGATMGLIQAVEVKCPRPKKHVETIMENAVPKEYQWQVAHIFKVSPKTEVVHFVSFCPQIKTKPLFHIEIYRDDQNWQGLLDQWDKQYGVYVKRVEEIVKTVKDA